MGCEVVAIFSHFDVFYCGVTLERQEFGEETKMRTKTCQKTSPHESISPDRKPILLLLLGLTQTNRRKAQGLLGLACLP